MSDYKLGYPFGIDNDELNGVTPEKAFVLGGEFVIAMRELQRGVAATIHEANIGRVKDAARYAGITVRCLPLGDGIYACVPEKTDSTP